MTDSSLNMSTASLLSRSQPLEDQQQTPDNSSIFSSLPSLPSLPPIDDTVLQHSENDEYTTSPVSSSFGVSGSTHNGNSIRDHQNISTSWSSSPEQSSLPSNNKNNDNNGQKPSVNQLVWGHIQSFSSMAGRFMFKDNNLPLILNVIGHLLAARQLWLKGSVTRYTNLQSQQKTVVMDQFRSIGVLHLAMGLLAALALKERRLSTERTALWVLSLAAWSQTFVQARAYLQSPSLYTLKAIQEWGGLNAILTIITTVALRKTVRRTGRL
ncbi:uncharacterized protein BX664DRAFT_321839, partial [Halteromyces radiatus]|uniref:uncharacterized protein n=1 Tax=Halteromyces radiatus TaxID=101107 RepID=UPI0022201699